MKDYTQKEKNEQTIWYLERALENAEQCQEQFDFLNKAKTLLEKMFNKVKRFNQKEKQLLIEIDELIDWLTISLNYSQEYKEFKNKIMQLEKILEAKK